MSTPESPEPPVPETYRGHVAAVRLNDAELARLRDVAQANSMSVSAFLRELVLREVGVGAPQEDDGMPGLAGVAETTDPPTDG